jgi:hypothetical protein
MDALVQGRLSVLSLQDSPRNDARSAVYRCVTTEAGASGSPHGAEAGFAADKEDARMFFSSLLTILPLSMFDFQIAPFHPCTSHCCPSFSASWSSELWHAIYHHLTCKCPITSRTLIGQGEKG